MPKKPAVPTRAASMYDVARLAGVSHQTVSRVLNGHESLREETKAKVLKAMAQLNYRPNRAARTLATSKTNIIGVLASDANQFGPASLSQAIDTEARAAGYFVVSASIAEVSKASIADAVSHLLELSIEALVVIAPQATVLDVVKPMAGNIPLVTIDSTERSDVFSVAVDNYQGARLATKHLIELGHKKIIHVTGPKGWVEAASRIQGFKDEMAAHGLPASEPIEGDWTANTGYELGKTLATGKRNFTAIFVANDQMAIGILHAFHDAKISIPNQVSIVGFDDLPEAAHIEPPLTTVRQDFNEVGKRAVALLLDELSGATNIRRERIIPKLKVRKSTATPTKSGK